MRNQTSKSGGAEVWDQVLHLIWAKPANTSGLLIWRPRVTLVWRFFPHSYKHWQDSRGNHFISPTRAPLCLQTGEREPTTQMWAEEGCRPERGPSLGGGPCTDSLLVPKSRAESPLTCEEGGLFPSSVTREVSMVSPAYAGSSNLTSRRREEGGGKSHLDPSVWVPTQLCPTLATPWSVAQQAPLSIGFSRQADWSGLPCLPPGDLLNPGIKTADSLWKWRDWKVTGLTVRGCASAGKQTTRGRLCPCQDYDCPLSSFSSYKPALDLISGTQLLEPLEFPKGWQQHRCLLLLIGWLLEHT